MKLSDVIHSEVAAGAYRERRLAVAKDLLASVLGRTDADLPAVRELREGVVGFCVLMADELLRQTGNDK